MEFQGLKSLSYDSLVTDQGCLFQRWFQKQESCNNILKRNFFATRIVLGGSYDICCDNFILP